MAVIVQGTEPRPYRSLLRTVVFHTAVPFQSAADELLVICCLFTAGAEANAARNPIGRNAGRARLPWSSRTQGQCSCPSLLEHALKGITTRDATLMFALQAVIDTFLRLSHASTHASLHHVFASFLRAGRVRRRSHGPSRLIPSMPAPRASAGPQCMRCSCHARELVQALA